MRKLAIFGSTGSVGSQTIEVIREYKSDFQIVALCAKRSSKELLQQVLEFKPKYVLTVEEPSREWLESLPKETVFLKFEEGLQEVIQNSRYVLNAIAGVDGLQVTYETLIREGKILLASNKESIVCLPKLVKENRERVIPVDSEHNALFQLLQIVREKGLQDFVKRIYLTASGGPFRSKTLEEIENVSVEDALNHPTWKMGSKISIDSATLMNKGIEILEALSLFDIELDKIDVVIHPQSVVHGIVELKDQSFIFHVSQANMKIPILHALFYPERKPYPFESKNILDMSPITFEKVDVDKFPAISLCKWVAQMSGAYVPVLLGADEVAVELFLEGKIKFTQIYKIVEEVLSRLNIKDPENVEQIKAAINWGKEKAMEVYRELLQ